MLYSTLRSKLERMKWAYQRGKISKEVYNAFRFRCFSTPKFLDPDLGFRCVVLAPVVGT